MSSIDAINHKNVVQLWRAKSTRKQLAAGCSGSNLAANLINLRFTILLYGEIRKGTKLSRKRRLCSHTKQKNALQCHIRTIRTTPLLPSTTLHDFSTGKIAYFAHRTKRGPGHNWSGTSACAEADMLDELLGKVRQDGLVVQEMVSDKDTSVMLHFVGISLRGRSHTAPTIARRPCTKIWKKQVIKLKIHFCDTLPLLRKVFYYMYIFHSDEDGWGRDSQRHIPWNGKPPQKMYWE